MSTSKQTNPILMWDDKAGALVIKEKTNNLNYFLVDTVNGSELMELGNVTTNPTLELLGTGDFTIGGSQNISAGEYIGLGGSSARLYFAAGEVDVFGASFGVNKLNPDGRLHVANSASGATVNANYTTGIFENFGVAGLSVLGTDAANQGLALGSVSNSVGAKFTWNYDGAVCQIGADNVGAQTQILSGAGVAAIIVDDTQRVGVGGAPAYLLDVAGTFNADGAARLGSTLTMTGGNIDLGAYKLVGNGGIKGVEIASGGKVGINTAPTQLLELKDTANFQLLLNGEGMTTISGSVIFQADRPNEGQLTGAIRWYNNGAGIIGGVRVLRGSTDLKGSMVLATSAVDRFVISEDGAVLISSLTASLPVFTNADQELVSNAVTGSGSVAMSVSPFFTGTVNAADLTLSGDLDLGFTLGSIPFEGLSGLTEDNANFFYDSGDGFLGVGTTAPDSRITMLGNGAADSAMSMIRHNNDMFPPHLYFKSARGTPGSPSQELSGDWVGQQHFQGYDGTNYQDLAYAAVVATEDVQSGSHGGKYVINTTDTGAASGTDKVVIDGTAIALKHAVDAQKSLALSARLDAGDGDDGTPYKEIDPEDAFYIKVTPSAAVTNEWYTLLDGVAGQMLWLRNYSTTVTAKIDNVDDGGVAYINVAPYTSILLRYDAVDDVWYAAS